MKKSSKKQDLKIEELESRLELGTWTVDDGNPEGGKPEIINEEN